MSLKFHSDCSSFYNEAGALFPEPMETLEDLEVKLKDAHNRLLALPKPKPASDYAANEDDDLTVDLGIARFNLCSFIENLEWKIDLKLLHGLQQILYP